MKNRILHALVGLSILSISCRGPQGPAGPPGSGIDDLTNPAILPRVIYTYPPANSEGPYEDLDFYYPRIMVRFNKIMTRSSLRRAVTISSPSTGVRADTSYIYSIGGDVFTIYPRDSTDFFRGFRWKLGETYTLAVSSSAQDVNGNSLLPSFSMTFAPEPHFRIQSISPSNGSTGVQFYTYIYLYFNSPVDTSIFSAIQIVPQIPEGRWLLYNSDSATIFFDHEGMNNSTAYTVTVSGNARDKYGNQLTQQFISSFSTEAFRVRYTYPPNGNSNVSLNSSISVNFSGPIDTGTVRSAVSISPAVAGYFSLYDGSSNFDFYPTIGLAGNTLYTITISTLLRSKNGTNLSAPYSFSFTTAPFRVISTSPSNGQTNVSRYTSIYVYLDGTLDTASIRSAFSISPSVAGNFSFYDPTSYFYFYPSTLAANQTYNVTINTGLRSKSGSNLASPYTFSFTTGN